ncbi:glycoside hydrolase family 78 protein [Actinoallomurus purpureus]|uniref:alpha-L-rhamnosidase n=1 Tax=Actinoallomurus purpureus TaxID=478114 RepID=UPI00209383CF|nr:alpha-L-rhamnosidase [Actinoallomurus purpureus]MCO6003831.1 glycoside hydrolase family 78 protein [Actinoallomurus purpureus]
MSGGGVRPYALRCDHRTTPLGIGEPAPLLSWRLAAEPGAPRGAACVAHRVEVRSAPEGPPVWDTGRVADPDGIGVVYAGPALAPRTRYHWRVTVWETEGASRNAESWFETGLGPDDWTASWIAPDWTAVEVVDPPVEGERALDSHGLRPCPLLRRAFTAPAAPVRARLYVSARGLYEARINGERVGDAELAPGWTDYRHRVQYQTYDVTGLITPGENVLAATIADGWWSGYVGFDPRRPGCHYGGFPQLIAQLHLDHADESRQVVATDESWRTADGPIRYADLLMGECHDLRHAIPGWDCPEFDDDAWRSARVADDDTARLVPSVDEPVRALGELGPVAVTRVGPDAHIVDFGQNFAGRLRLTARGLRDGQRVVLRHAETLDDGGGLYTANLRTAAATDVLIGGDRGGGDAVVFEPRFTYHGFRYAEVTGLADLDAGDVTGVVLHSDTPWAGTFDCSDPGIRRLHHNITWGQRSNFVSVPTDCPQRDERLGWLADAQVFLPTACLGADVAAFFAKWTQDVRDAQGPDGGFSNVAPLLAGVADEGAPGWADAGVLIPWHLYRVYGDERFLARSLDSMYAWVDLVHRHNPDLVWRHRVGPHFADWLAIGRPTPREVVATAYFAHSAELTARAAGVLGDERAGRYAALARDIRATFTDRFATPDGRIEGDTQTAYALALHFELLPDGPAAGAADRLAELVEEAGPGLTTGFLGVGLIAPVLDRWGRADLAHALLRRTEPPSWLYPLRHGATTIWERWDGYTDERGFQAPAMNSFNHYALGSVGEWLYRGLAGLDQAPGSVAYREPLIRPRPFRRPGESHWAEASHESARGRIAVRWEQDDDGLRLAVSVPPGATATVHIPVASGSAVRENGLPVGESPGIEIVGTEPAVTGGSALVCRVGSGDYRFSARRTG